MSQDVQSYLRAARAVMLAHLPVEKPPAINPETLARHLRAGCGTVEALGERQHSLLQFACLDHMSADVRGAAAPASILVALPGHDQPPPATLLGSALPQSTDWPEAQAALESCRAMLTVTDFNAASLPYRERLALFQAALDAVLEAAPCRALYWRASERLVSPEAYRRSRQGPDPDPLFAAVSVRAFRVAGGAPDELVMDTLGMAAFGLPDAQCHFRALNPGQVSGLLLENARALFDGGQLSDGDTVAGLLADRPWTCRREGSLIDPPRPVVDLDPGPPFAAGR